MNILVSTQWLSDNADAENLVILDASAHLPDSGRDAAAEFAQGHIPSARFLDLPSLKDLDSQVPAALPTANQFADRMRTLGITATDTIILYDDSMLRSSARAFFIFTMFGMKNVAVLDGGIAKWKAEGRTVETGTREIPASNLPVPEAQNDRVRSKADMLANCDSRAEQVVDARDSGRFSAAVDDAVHGLAGGHIPGARNLHFVQLFTDEGTFKEPAALRQIFESAGLDLSKPITGSCGSGMTASVLLFALELIGHDDTALYDGSWSEWGADPETPKETGAAQ